MEFSGIDSSQGSAAYLNSWRASARKIMDPAGSVLRDCQKKKYRKLLDEGTIIVRREARAALE